MGGPVHISRLPPSKPVSSRNPGARWQLRVKDRGFRVRRTRVQVWAPFISQLGGFGQIAYTFDFQFPLPKDVDNKGDCFSRFS